MEKNFRNRTKEKRLCSEAVQDILDYELVYEKEIQFLVHKYRWLNKVIPFTPNGIAGDFHKLYDNLNTLKYYLDSKSKAIEALEAYQLKRNWDEPTIIDWLLEYEETGNLLGSILYNTMFSDMQILGDGFGNLHESYSLKVGTIDFYPIIDFVWLFNQHYEANNKTLSDYINPSVEASFDHVYKNYKEGLDGLKDLTNYEIADRLAEEAIEEETKAIDRDKWLKEYKDLFNSLSIQPAGLPSIANAHMNGRFFEQIANFHRLYHKRKFESTILSEMTHYHATCYFISTMDIIALDKILDYREYADVEKPIFLNKLEEAFEIFKNNGNTRLIETTGVCKGCKNGCPTIAFIGDNDTHYIELLIETENDRVKDIYECNSFKYDTYNTNFLGKRISLDCSAFTNNRNLGLDDDMPF